MAFCVLLCVGLIYLLAIIQCMHSSPTKLNLCHSGITSRGVNRLIEVVQFKCETADVLETLDLSDNCFKGEDVTVSVSCFLCCAWLTVLLNTEIEMVWSVIDILVYLCPLHITTLAKLFTHMCLCLINSIN